MDQITSESECEKEQQPDGEDTSKKLETPIKASLIWEKKEKKQKSLGKRIRAGRRTKKRKWLGHNVMISNVEKEKKLLEERRKNAEKQREEMKKDVEQITQQIGGSRTRGWEERNRNNGRILKIGAFVWNVKKFRLCTTRVKIGILLYFWIQ